MNYLEQPLQNVLTKIELNQGYLNHIAHDLDQFNKKLVSELNSELKFLKGTKLVISDLTGETENGWEINFPTNTPGYLVTSENYLEKNLEIFSIVSLNLTVQNYEAIERFMKDIFIVYFKHNELLAKETIGKINLRYDRDQINWRQTIQQLNKGVNKKSYLEILRELSPEFKVGEQKNLHNINLKDWFEMISLVRHSIVHSNSIIKNEEANKLSTNMKENLNNFFNICNKANGSIQVTLDVYKQKRLFKFFAEYCFFVFKSLSNSLELDWKILKYMNNEA